MKRTMIATMISMSLCLLNADEVVITGDGFIPDTGENMYDDRPPEYNGTGEILNSITYEPTGTTITPVEASTLETTSENTFGDIQISPDMNWSDPVKLDKFYKDNTKGYLDSANNFVEDFRNAAENKFTDKTGRALSNEDLSDFSETAIVQNFEEESDARSVLAFKEDLFREMRAKLVLSSSIQCYITRRLNNSYYCPLPGYEVSTYGGDSKDSKDEALRMCNEVCKIQTGCLAHKNMDNMTYSNTGTYTLPVRNLELPLNPSQITKELSFDYMPKDVNEIQDGYFNDGNVRSRITVTGIDIYDNPYVLYDKYDYGIKKEGGRISLSINRKLKKIRLHFYSSYIFDPRHFVNVKLYGNNPSVEVGNINIGYLSDSRYFCPVTQFEGDARKCDGRIETLSFGGASYSVCVPREEGLASTRSPIDGGYYREDQCNEACVESEECVPTYRHLIYHRNAISDSSYNIEYGCVVSEDNVGCTDEKCRAFFEQDTQPAKEKVWEHDDEVVETVSSGVDTGTSPRPRVDFEGEISAEDQDRTQLFSEEMKDVSYQNMVREESFNITKEVIGEVIGEKSAVDIRVNNLAKQISMKLLYKPRNTLVDANTTIHLYPVMEVVMIYNPIKPIYANNRLYYPEKDERIKAKDKVFLLKKNNSWYPFKRELFNEYYLPTETEDGEIVYKWFLATGSTKTHLDTYDAEIKDYAVYPPDMIPNDSLSLEPTSDKPWEEITMFYNLESVINQEGVLFTHNDARNGKQYDPAVLHLDTKAYYHGYKMHLITSVENELDYSSISSKIGDSSLVYDSMNPKASRTEIEPDSLYADDRVHLYVLGDKGKRTVFMKMKPRSTEEEHKGIVFMFTHE